LTKLDMFDLSGLTVTRILRDDSGAMLELQDLLERCADYYELHEGQGPHPTAAADEFDLVPSEHPRDDIFVLGYRSDGRVVAEMSLLRAYPKENEWWVALFVVDPTLRSRGLGRRICDATFQWIASIGGTTMVIAVDEENPRAATFWRALEFVETRRADYKAPTGMQRRVILMRRTLP
jgi:GNAT superfamily N-acetyltransferase